MPTTVTPAFLNEITDRIVRNFQPEQVILFGSQARGDATPDSDIDLLIVMPDGTDRRSTAVAIRSSLRGLGIAKDIIVTTPTEIAHRGNLIGTVLYPALQEGKTLYVHTRRRGETLAAIRH